MYDKHAFFVGWIKIERHPIICKITNFFKISPKYEFAIRDVDYTIPELVKHVIISKDLNDKLFKGQVVYGDYFRTENGYNIIITDVKVDDEFLDDGDFAAFVALHGISGISVSK